MECDIMNRLFDLDLDELIQKIFLSLDPLSLKSCKCVSSEWFHFIQNRLWNSKPARKQLHNRLINQWKFSEPFVTEYGQGMMGVNFLVCDDEIIVCGYTRGQARVYDVDTGELRYQLQCNSQSLRVYDGVQLDLGRTVIGSVTDNGFVSVWEKKDGSLLYQAKHHGEHQSVFGIKVTDEYVLTGGGDGSLIMLEKVEGVWKITHEMFENREGVTHIDADGKWAVTGSRQSIKMWDLEEHKIVKSDKPVKVKVWMLSFTYPLAYVVGGEDWNGVQIWDLSKSELLRHVAEDGKPFHNVQFNGRFLTVSEFNITWRGENDEKVSVAVYDALELLDKKIENKNLWKKSFGYSPGAYFEQINAVSNKTSLIVTHATTISILNFWKDRIIPSREVVPAEMIEDEDDEDWETEESLSEEDEEHRIDD